jgi:hypothetical protein
MIDINSDSFLTYGYCNSCKKVHRLKTGRAIELCFDLMDKLESEKRIDFETPIEMADPNFSTDILWGDERGEMFGVLVCEDELGQEIILKAFSCQHGGEWSCDGWALPLVDSELYLKRCREVGAEIKEFTSKINSLEKGSDKFASLKKERKELSQNLQIELHNLYSLSNFRGEVKSLEEAFIYDKGIPTGAGDCCAPKLLNEAAKKGLKPKGLAEFYWGKENRSKTKQHKEFYSSCEDKCQPILGFLLCGGVDE